MRTADSTGNTMGPETLGLAHGAVFTDLDVAHTTAAQDESVNFFQVYEILTAASPDKGENLFAEGGQQRIGYVGIGFKVAETDVRTNGGVDIFCLAAEIFNHGGYSFRSDGGNSAAPAGMGSAHSAGDRIVKQQRGAVGGKHCQCNTGVIGHQCVTFRIVPMEAAVTVAAAYHTYNIRMGLAGQNQIFDAESQCRSQNLKIAGHIFVGLIQFDGQIHAGKGAAAHAAQAGGEAMGDSDALCG